MEYTNVTIKSLKISEIKESDIIGISGKAYYPMGFEAINAELYPRRAQNISGTLYLRCGKRGNVYSIPVAKNGDVRIDRQPENCGKWTQEDIEKLGESLTFVEG